MLSGGISKGEGTHPKDHVRLRWEYDPTQLHGTATEIKVKQQKNQAVPGNQSTSLCLNALPSYPGSLENNQLSSGFIPPMLCSLFAGFIASRGATMVVLKDSRGLNDRRENATERH